MCGITGVFDSRGGNGLPADALRRMNDAQLHRGPDEGSVHLEPGLGLGHRRLSIIDVATGQQPLFNEDGSVVVVFNGEIYNYQDLMAELQALGHTFRTRSDTEVIVHAWEAWGDRCVDRFRGMFAFALWDRNRRTLFLARDRMGVKPLHYAVRPNGVVLFGSEIKALLAWNGPGALARGVGEIDPLAVEEYMALGYVADPRSIYRGIRKLPAAHTLVWRQGQPEPEPRAYWDVRFTLDSQATEDEVLDGVRQRIDEAVRVRLMSEVPLGAFLSGGVDSSAVVASMAQASSTPVTTCAIGFDVPEFNESGFAQQVAERYGTDHRLEVVGTDLHGLIDELARLYDEPFADSSALPTWRVCQMARRHVTVALSGDGGDESMAGYRRYRMHANEDAWRRRLPAGLRQPLFGALGRWYPKADWAPRMFRAKTTFQAMAQDATQAYLQGVSRVRQEQRDALFTPALKQALGGYRVDQVFKHHAAAAGTDDAVALFQYLDYKTWLVGDINTKVDRASMAHSLEVREPLMDHLLIEWLATLPTHWKLRNGQGKALLKKAMEPRLPHEVLYRPKMGFSVPLAQWLRGPLRPRLQAAVSGERLSGCGFFEPMVMQQWVDQHTSGRVDHATGLWALLMFDAFLAQADGQPA